MFSTSFLEQDDGYVSVGRICARDARLHAVLIMNSRTLLVHPIIKTFRRLMSTIVDVPHR